MHRGNAFRRRRVSSANGRRGGETCEKREQEYSQGAADPAHVCLERIRFRVY
jgi:hypothetical protein